MKCYLNLKIDCSTVTKILKKANKYNQLQDDDEQAEKTFRHHTVKYSMLELIINMYNRLRKITLYNEAASALLKSLPREWLKLQELFLQILSEINELEISKIEISEESELENDINDAATLVNNLSVENNLRAQELINNIEEYTYMIDQLAIIENVLTDEGIIEMVKNKFCEEKSDDSDEESLPPPSVTLIEAVKALEKIISYQESLKIRKDFNENGLVILRKQLKEWYYKREKNKKQALFLSFFNRIN
ncbi:1906_t:CDS:2 [Cetraspora pellucida]|uniref:1906_t:CDS:1 n=1 Tax=Cetraspora pellucida TaxID=1433469 RepID=A0ACA9KTS2_9GLOM|nr:1906_t:CDS:2 [Cetraspora pellucida]